MDAVENVWKHFQDQINHVCVKFHRVYEIPVCLQVDVRYVDAMVVTPRTKRITEVEEVFK